MRSSSEVTTTNPPAFLMNVPLSLSTDVPNNAWMEEMSADEREIIQDRALRQFFDLYDYLSSHALVYLLPSKPGLQDQTYVANLGSVLPHLAEQTLIIARFRAMARAGEVPHGRRFFELMGFRLYSPPAYFEGEADLKHLRGNLYVGAHGMRTSLDTLGWLEAELDMHVIPFAIDDPYLYHLDSCLLPLTSHSILLCTKLASPSTLRRLEQHVDIIDVTLDDAYSGITNCVVLHDKLLCGSNPAYLRKGHEFYEDERSKIATLERVCAQHGFSPVVFDLSEFYKSGALLSCLVLHLNRANYLR